MPKLQINGLDVFFDVFGGGRPLVLISGVSSDHAGWKATQVPEFNAAGFRCLLFDNRDVGQTGESPVSGYTTRQFADDTAELIRKLDFAPAHVVGASMGGMIAQEMALNHPDCVRSLTLVCTAAKADSYLRNVIEAWKTAASKYTKEEFLQARMPWIFTHRFYEKTETIRAYRERVLGNPFPQTVAGFHRQCDTILTHDAMDRLHTIQAPTHVVVGAEDILIPPRHSQTIAERIPGAKLTVLSDTGHCLFWETPSEFNRIVLEFLR
jgi:pimeloyl-ACP methyl ester carboxylesterase